MLFDLIEDPGEIKDLSAKKPASEVGLVVQQGRCVGANAACSKAEFACRVYWNGLVAVDWKKGPNSLGMKVTILPNTTARVSVPKLGLKEIAVTESRKPVWKAGKFVADVAGIGAGSETDDYVTFDVGSGYYLFKLNGRT